MKILFILVISLIITGCSATYTITDFPSQDNFYNKFNNYAKDKTVEIKMTDDSVVKDVIGAKVIGDSLFYFQNNPQNKRKLRLNEINSILYNNEVYYPEHTATISLTNGQYFKGIDIVQQPDSTIEFIFIKKNSVSLNRINEIVYNEHWLGVPMKTLLGGTVGLMTGIVIGSVFISSKSKQNEYTPTYIAVGLTAIGAITGGILGYINGYRYIFVFN